MFLWYLASKSISDQYLLLSYVPFTAGEHQLLSSHQSLEIFSSLEILLMVLSLIPFQSCEDHNRIMLVSSRPYIFSFQAPHQPENTWKFIWSCYCEVTEFFQSVHQPLTLILIARILLRHIFKVGSWRTGLILKNLFFPKERCPKAVLDISSVGCHTQIWGNQVSFSFIFYLLFLFAIEEWF